MSKRRNKLARALRLLRGADQIGDDEYAEYLYSARTARKATRKQRQAAMRNLRRACQKIETTRVRPESAIEQKVKKLRKEVRETLRKEELREELKNLRKERARLRELIRSHRAGNAGGFGEGALIR